MLYVMWAAIIVFVIGSLIVLSLPILPRGDDAQGPETVPGQTETRPD